MATAMLLDLNKAILLDNLNLFDLMTISTYTNNNDKNSIITTVRIHV